MGITGYVLALALVIPIAGWLVNQFNGKYVFIGASILFGITSVLAGISWNAESFIVFRIIQGMSAGIITTLMFTLLIKTTGQDNIGKVMAVVSTPIRAHLRTSYWWIYNSYCVLALDVLY